MGPWEIALILVIILIVFGVGKLPQAASAIGKGLRAYRRTVNGEDEDDKEGTPEAESEVAEKVTGEKEKDNR